MKTVTRSVPIMIVIALLAPLFLLEFGATAHHVRVQDGSTTKGLLDIKLTRSSGRKVADI